VIKSRITPGSPTARRERFNPIVDGIRVTPEVNAAVKEILKRRRSRTGLLDFTRYTFPRFESSWHHEIICKVLERVDNRVHEPAIVNVNGTEVDLQLPEYIRRVMVFAPPRHTKSELVSIRRPAWSIGRDPRRMYMNITYGNDLSYTFSKACRNTMLSPPYQRLFPGVSFDRVATERWKIKRKEEDENQRDSMIASGILSPLTGEGATDINVDDPFKNKSEAYSKTIRNRVYDEYTTSIRTRLQPGGSICLMLTRWHNDDLAARLLENARKNKKADQWIVVVLAATNDEGKDAYILNTATQEQVALPAYDALWPGWFDRDNLEATKASTSNAFWMAMYQQRPVNFSGSIFLADKWGEFEGVPDQTRTVHVWDTAMEDNDDNDYSAQEEMTIFNNRYYITSAYRERLTFPNLVKAVYDRWEAALAKGVYPERCLIENKGSGISLIQQIEANNVDPTWERSRIPVLAMPATLNKTVRALSVSGYQNSGLVSLPLHGADDWKADFIDEHSDFDKGKNDDFVDCTVHALTYFTRPIAGEEYEETVVWEDEVTINDTLDKYDQGFF
jgi:predicted phage terminase large subunit-like protein